MKTEELVAALEACTLPPSAFSHESHVEVAWQYLCRYPREEAGRQFVATLRRYVAHVGAQGKFQMTMTVAMVRLIHACGPAAGQDWLAFRQAHPELFAGWRSLLDRHYSPEALERGRAVFVEADREPLP